jgi:multidrug efflux pump subunit AcrA (membrane-fusion protein)
MDDSNFDNSEFLSGEIFPANINNNGHHLATIARETEPGQNGALVPFPQSPAPSGALVPFQEPDYAIVHQTTPAEFLPAIGRWVMVGGMVMVGSFGAAIALSTFLKYKVTVQAPAAIRPEGEQRLVQSTIEGSVLSILARENQTVRKGDPIATVKDLRLESKLQTKRGQLAGDIQKSKQQLSAIDTQLVAFDRQGAAEIEQSNRSIAGIRAELSRAERDHHDKQIATQADVAEAQANWKTAQKEQQAAAAELTVADANLKSIQAGYQSAATKSQRYESAATEGAISKNLLEEAQLATEQQAQSIAAQEATIFKQQQLVARTAQTVAAAAKVQRTQVALNPLRAESETLVQKIASERANAKAAIARRQQEHQKLLQQRVETANQLASTEREFAQIATDLKPTPILAPISGTIQELNLRNNLQVVNPGDRIAKIIPAVTPLNIKANVAISDIDNVKVGQTVQMRVSACPYTDYGVVSGKVREVSADAKSIEKNASNNNNAQQSQPAANGIYEVTIKPDALTLHQGNKTCQIRAGMDGRADIISKEESVLQFILKKARLWDL